MNTLRISVKEMKRAGFVLLFSLFIGIATTAQAQTLTIGSVLACAAPEVFVPVTGSNLVGIGSITLYISFDSSKVIYQSLENIDPQLNGVIYSLNTSPFQLAIVWTKVTPINFSDKKLFDIHFKFKGESTPVFFNADCEISNSQLQILPVNYLNGSVYTGLLPEIILQPKDTLVKPWAQTSFTISSTNSPGFAWKESTDHGQTWSELSDNAVYKGTHSPQLLLTYTPPAFNKYQYICSLNTQDCYTTTLPATLTVDTLASVNGYEGAKIFLLQNKPNPIHNFTFIEYTLPAKGKVSLKIVDLYGKLIAQPVTEIQTKGTYTIRFDASELTPGIYFYQLQFNNENSGFIASRKMIKQLN